MPEIAPSPALGSVLQRRLIGKIAWTAMAVVGCLLGLILVTPHFLDLAFFKRSYLPLLEDAFNRRIDVDEVHLSLVPTPAIRLSQLTVSNTPPIADNLFFSVQQIRLKLRFLPLLRGQFEITELVLDRPIVNLIKQPDGTLAATKRSPQKAPGDGGSGLRQKGPAAKPVEPGATRLAIPNRMRVQNGELNVITKGLAPINIKGIDVALQEFTAAAPFPFRLAFNYPGFKSISLEGQLNYLEEQDLLELKNNRLEIGHLTLPLDGHVTHLAGAPRLNLRLQSENLEASALLPLLAALDLAPRDLDAAGPMALSVRINGPLNRLFAQVHGQLKDVKVHSKRAFKGVLSGVMDLQVELAGAPLVRRLQGNGKFTARNGELTNADLVKKIQRVTGMIGLSKDERRETTAFQRIEADFTISDGLADFSRLFLLNRQMEADGNGTLTLERPTLSMAVRTTLSPQASLRAGRGRAAAYLKNRQGRIVVPLKVSGPLENPAVTLNSEKLLASGVPKSAEVGLESLFKGLFRSR